MKTRKRDNIANAAIEVMESSFSHQEDPDVGIFWYDGEELFGVASQPAEDRKFYKSEQFDAEVRTGSKLHKTIWDKLRLKGDSRCQGDYTRVMRGKVFEFKGIGFVVMTGSWINDHPEAREQIIDEFNLPSSAVFKIDSHWDLGHGWSDEF